MSSVFDDLIDQDAVIATLKGAVAASKDNSNNSQEMTHSWLFTGPPGSGRSNAAIAFAAALLCEEGGCATCINCTSVVDGSHADIELIRTEGLSIKVDEVRELITRTSWSPSVGNYRIVVIEDADRLTESAANALLKVIEEPGARTVWLLCAPTLTDIIPTIRSRCRHLTLRTPSVKSVAKLLIERDGIDPELADFAASAAQGHVGRAKYLATIEEARKIRDIFRETSLRPSSLNEAYQIANHLNKEIELMTTATMQDSNQIINQISDSDDDKLIIKLRNKIEKINEEDKKIKEKRITIDHLNWFIDEKLFEISKQLKEQIQIKTDAENVDKLRQATVLISLKNSITLQRFNKTSIESLFVNLYYHTRPTPKMNEMK
jgi:DNA polymerase III subunit delta'